MQDWLLNNYSWIKWWHFAGFISWMSVVFYLPRLFVYHAEHIDNKDFTKVVKIQEKMLLHGIGWIAMIVTIISGVGIIIAMPELLKQGYFHIKLLCALLLIVYQFSLWYFTVKFKDDSCKLSGKFFRAYNEFPTILMFIILWAMLIKPTNFTDSYFLFFMVFFLLATLWVLLKKPFRS